MIKTNTKPARNRSHVSYESLDSNKLHEAADRALDHYLSPNNLLPPSRKARGMYAVTADTKNEELLADASETLASAKTIAQDISSLLPAPQRRALLGVAQLIMLGEMAVNRMMDNLEVAG